MRIESSSRKLKKKEKKHARLETWNTNKHDILEYYGDGPRQIYNRPTLEWRRIRTATLFFSVGGLHLFRSGENFYYVSTD